MIELNLLPKELRKHKRTVTRELPILPAAITIVIIVVLVQAVLLVSIHSKRARISGMERKWSEMGTNREIVDRIFGEINDLERRVEVSKNIGEPAFDWAELMSGLNQAMIPQVWLSEFVPSFPKGKIEGEPTIMLNLTGYALGGGEVATSTVAKFMNSLKTQKGFFKYFDEIELKNMSKMVLDGEDVMKFSITCRGKEKIKSAKIAKAVKKAVK